MNIERIFRLSMRLGLGRVIRQGVARLTAARGSHDRAHARRLQARSERAARNLRLMNRLTRL